MFSISRHNALAAICVMPSESVDLVLTDPPYASLEAHRATGTTTRLTKKWFPVVPNEAWPAFFVQLHRVLRRDSHLYVMTDWASLRVLADAGEAAGFKLWKPLVWDKMKMGMGYHYRASCEFILFFEKGKRRLTSLGIRDVLPCPSMRGADLYPTEKPVDLLEILVQQSSLPGDLVFDPFAGSGSSGEAAVRCGRRWMGWDLELDAVERARTRLIEEFGEEPPAVSGLWGEHGQA